MDNQPVTDQPSAPVEDDWERLILEQLAGNAAALRRIEVILVNADLTPARAWTAVSAMVASIIVGISLGLILVALL